MPKYVVFRFPNIAWDGVDWMHAMIEDRDHYLDFAVVTAKNMQEAREKYFYKYVLVKSLDEDDTLAYASRCAYSLGHDYEEDEIIEIYGDKDGKILWDITVDCNNRFLDHDLIYNLSGYEWDKEYYNENIKCVSNDCIKKLCFRQLQTDIGVTDIVAEIK